VGSGISGRYSNLTPQFDVGYWKVSAATQKAGKKVVSVWIFDEDRLKVQDKSKEGRRKYMTHVKTRITAQRKVSHRGVLEIVDVALSGNSIASATPAIESVLSRDKSLSRDEAMLVVVELAAIMDGLHNELHVALGSLTLDNVFFLKDFCVMTGLFMDATPFQETTEELPLQFSVWGPGTGLVIAAPSSLAPEIASGRKLSAVSDVCQYGLCCISVFTNTVPGQTDAGWAATAIKSVPRELQRLLTSCVAREPERRPRFVDIAEDKVFSSMICRVFQYIGTIDGKEARDKFTFFAGLREIISVFSVRLLQYRFLKVFGQFLRKDPRFGIPIVSLAFAIEAKMDDETFITDIMQQMQPVVCQIEVP